MPDIAYALKDKLKIHNTNVFTGAGNITCVNEGVVIVKKASGAATTVTLPPNPERGDFVLVKDGKGDAATNNITVQGAASATIDGAASLLVATNYESNLFGYNGTEWGVVSRNRPTTSSGAEINAVATGQPATATIVPAASTANVSLVTITVKDGNGVAVTAPVMMDVLLSDAATGAGLTATTASGAVAAGASGADIATLVAKKALRVQTTAAGVYILSVTDSAKTQFYVAVNIPGLKPVVTQVLTANYG